MRSTFEKRSERDRVLLTFFLFHPRNYCKLSLCVTFSNTFDNLSLEEHMPGCRCILLSWIPSCFRLVNMCFLQFNLRSKCGPKYLASLAWGIFKLFKVTSGHVSLRVVNVTCTDFASLTLILHFFHFFHFWTYKRLSCKRRDASIWSCEPPE